MFTTVSGMLTSVRVEQAINAESPMLVTFLLSICAGMFAVVFVPVYFVISIVPLERVLYV